MNKMVFFNLICFGPIILAFIAGFISDGFYYFRRKGKLKKWVVYLFFVGLFINGLKLALGN